MTYKVTHKKIISKCSYDWRSIKLDSLPDEFTEYMASKIGLNRGDITKLKNRGFIYHINTGRDVGYWHKYKICNTKQ